ncbi:MAG TPA: methyltransferase domain-containing protein [Dehalococcoidia bacterium]|nr:methyltransferase domain-containing protein [Dehalococcoidia bacterium]
MSSGIKSFDRVADVYDATRGLPPEVEARVADGIARVLRDAGAAGRVVEFGVGTGRIAVPLAERGVRVTGVDVSPKMLGVLRGKRPDVAVVLSEASRTPFRDAAFAAAIFVHILHLVPDADATVREAFRVVRPGGLLLSGGDARFVGIEEAIRDLQEALITKHSGQDENLHQRYAVARTIVADVVRERGGAVESMVLARWQRATTGREVLERLRRRDFSGSWRIKDEALPAVVAEMEAELTRLLGSLDQELRFERAFGLVVGRGWR